MSAFLFEFPSKPITASSVPFCLRKTATVVALSCPLCFGVLDKFGSHAEDCMAGGDAVLTHNEIRDTTFKLAKPSGTNPELEKTKLLANNPSGPSGHLN